MPKTDYSSWPKEDLIKKINALEKRKKYGLVWDSAREPEKVVLDCQKELPVLKEIKDKEIHSSKNGVTHILIEGDNYHALSVLNYTHEKSVDVIYIDPPYNTGAKDWKYNNNYVDMNDAYRHSKWLSFMDSRLRLAKSLLKENGVLICTVDDNEQAALGLLLRELFPNREITCVTIVHNPSGIQGKNFSYSNEYAFFVYRGDKKVIAFEKRTDESADVRQFMNTAKGRSSNYLRSSGLNCFYPILVENLKIIGFGDICNESFHPKAPSILRKDGITEVYPVDADGVERKWVFSRQSVESIRDELSVKFNKPMRIISIIRTKKDINYKTVWFEKKFNAKTYGTQLLNNIIDAEFPFPKSLYAVEECIKAVVHDRNNAIILDFFAGSGTTGHAVSDLNKEDGGHRQFILCTNNENNICEEVCYPRIKKVMKGYNNSKGEVIEGLGGNLKYYETAFVPAALTDKNKELLTKQSIEMLALKEGTFEIVTENPSYVIYRNSNKYTGIIFDQLSFDGFKKAVAKIDKPISLYIFSLADEDFSDDFADIKSLIKICAIPEAILRVYRRVF